VTKQEQSMVVEELTADDSVVTNVTSQEQPALNLIWCTAVRPTTYSFLVQSGLLNTPCCLVSVVSV
jgi:hypothetical protein